MVAIITPEVVLVEHLRTHLTDPRSRDTSTNTESFTASASQTTFSLTPPSSSELSAITSITVDSVASDKWEDYYIDFQNKDIIFYTALSGGESVEITYKYGTNWIFPDRPAVDKDGNVLIELTDWPRIAVMVTGGTSSPLGQHGSDQEDLLLVTIEAHAKDDYKPTINSTKYDAVRLTKYLVHQCKKYLRTDIEDTYPELYDFRVLNQPRSLPFDVQLQTEMAAMDLQMRGLNTGE